MYVDSLRLSAGHLLCLLLFAPLALAQRTHTSTVPFAEYPSSAIDGTYGEPPRSAFERVERDFARQRPTPGETSSGPAGTISVEELRHPISAKARKLIEQGQRYAGNGEHDKAIQEFKRAMAEPSAVPYAHSLLGTEYLRTKNIPRPSWNCGRQ
jgi:hypothetical protein